MCATCQHHLTIPSLGPSICILLSFDPKRDYVGLHFSCDINILALIMSCTNVPTAATCQAHSVIHVDPSNRFRTNSVQEYQSFVSQKRHFHLEWVVVKGYMAKKDMHGINFSIS